MMEQILKVIRHFNLNSTEKLLLVYLLLYPESRVYSNNKFEDAIGTSIPSILRALKQLKELNYIDIEYIIENNACKGRIIKVLKSNL